MSLFSARKRKRAVTAACAGGGRLIWLFVCLFQLTYVRAQDVPSLMVPLPALRASQLAVIVNEDDPQSVAVGEYYRKMRNIPDRNMIHVRFYPGSQVMHKRAFQRVKAEVDALTPPQVQAFALTWTRPYRVGCMSITTAFAAGFDPRFCASACLPTRKSPYYNSDSRAPFRSFGWRPSMMLAGKNIRDVRALIDRGVGSDSTYPQGTVFLMDTYDTARNSRAYLYPGLERTYRPFLDIRIVRGNAIFGQQNILFYFTGLKRVQGLLANSFVPGAIADHLTSYGGRHDTVRQMPALRWLEAGATGSYGTVVEPCSFTQKFPNPAIVLFNYLRGSSLLEAYWKSVAWPGQGLFIGEPLARPFGERRR